MVIKKPAQTPLASFERNLYNSKQEGVWGAAMNGLSMSFLAPLAIAMGATSSVIALFSSLPGLVGSWSQLGASSLISMIPNRRMVIVLSSFLTALVWIPIILLPFLSTNIYILIGIVCLYAILGNIVQPVWTSLMGDLVPESRRGFFFAQRSKYIVLVMFVSMIAAGLVLSVIGEQSYYGFAIIFSAACICQLVSTYYKSQLEDAPVSPRKPAAFSFLDFLHKGRKTHFGRFVLFAALIKCAVNIAHPFFAVYMISYLKFDYLTFTLILSSSVIFKYLTMNQWGRFIDKRGNRIVITRTSIFVPLIALLWVLSPNPIYLFFVEALSGIVWAGLDLAISNYVFDAVRPENRIKCTAYYNTIVGKAVFVGASIGGLILAYVPSIGFLVGVPVVFFASFLCRALVLVMLPNIRELRIIEVKQGSSFVSIFDDAVSIVPSSREPIEIIPVLRTQKPRAEIIIKHRLIPAPKKEDGDEFVRSMIKRMNPAQKSQYAPKIDRIFDKLHKGRYS